LYCRHPNIFSNIEKFSDRYIQIRSASIPKKLYRKAFIDKKQLIESKINKLKINEISRFQFVKTVEYKCLPHAN
jgi:hypothetical protein